MADLNRDRCEPPGNKTLKTLCEPVSSNYFEAVVQGSDSTISWDNFGGIHWSLFGCFLAAWMIVCVCLIKGVRVSGEFLAFLFL